jgi:hypothetical protein
MSTTTVRQFFYENYIETGKIPQSFIDQYRGKTKGHKPQKSDHVIVGDVTFKYNGRRPKANDIMNYIKKENGLNWHLFKTLDLAKIGDDVEDIWNALHRAIIACVVEGPDAEVPALISHFDRPEDIHANFWKDNGGRTKQVTPEQNHVAQIRSLEPEAINHQIDEILKGWNNTVVYVEEDIFEPSVNKPEWSINVGPVKQMIQDIPSGDYITSGIRLYQEVFGHTYNGNKPFKIMGQIVQALSLILSVEAEYLYKSTKGKENMHWFSEWLKNRAILSPDKAKHWLYKNYTSDRMEKRYFGTAYGIWSDFVTYCGSSMTKGSGKATLNRLEKKYKSSLPSLDKVA